jgi:large subunit ribosomal protein L13
MGLAISATTAATLWAAREKLKTKNAKLKIAESFYVSRLKNLKNSLTGQPNSIECYLFAVSGSTIMKTFMAKKEQIEHKWWLVDADGAVLGRLAAKIAPILMGKTKPIYTPYVDTGDCVVVINAEKVKLTGKKAETKEYDHYTGYPGGHRFVSFAEMMTKKPEKVIELAVRRMMPKNALARKMLKKLKVYRGTEHEHQAQNPEKIKLN